MTVLFFGFAWRAIFYDGCSLFVAEAFELASMLD